MHSEDQERKSTPTLRQTEALRAELLRVKEDKKLSLDAFAHDTQYSRSSWNRVLKGEGFPPREAIERLCARRKLDPERLLQLWQAAADARRAQQAPATAAPPDTPTSDEPAEDPDATTAPRPPAQTHTAPGGTTPAQTGPVPPATAPVPTAPPATTHVPHAQDQPVERPAAEKKRNASTKALVLAGLVVALALGRWATLPDHKDTTAGSPPAAGDRPVDPQPSSNTTSPAPNDDKPDGQPKTPASTTDTGPLTPDPPSTGAPPPAEKPDAPGASSSDKATTPTPSRRPTAAPSAPSSVPLGAAGRANCPHKPNRNQVMAKGMVGSNVKQIQCLLNYNYDYTLALDSKFGEGTKTAVLAVQKCSGINADGQVGPVTWKYLEYPMSGCGH
ncbi:peptidoglycan-binding protein [Streptomyces sp. NPDC001455]|uniref:peptidoglycan-binding protein n=1 Tax=Streptomyces sp. NPDC001455 TaxID=3154518 RepID=UPI003318CA86